MPPQKQAQATSSSNRDQDATFTQRQGKPTYGYKGHIGVDADTTVIHSVEFTPAHIHDSNKFDDLIRGDERIILADKGYANKQRKKTLREHRIRCGILDKGYRDTPLTKKQIKRNKTLSVLRPAQRD